MRAYQLFEYQEYSKQKFIDRWSNEGKPYENEIGPDGEKFQQWLEQYDPTPNNKYVNWMTVRYLKGDIKRLEDIPARISRALTIYLGLQRKKKLQPEDKNLNSITDIESVVEKYADQPVQSNRAETKSIEKEMYDSGDAKLVYNDSEYKVVIPVTHKASCFFGKNTRWCTTTKDDSSYHDDYSKNGPLYIILHKPTNARWQFQFDRRQYMDEKDEVINLFKFMTKHPKIARVFEKLGKFELLDDGGYRQGPYYYDSKGEFHRDDAPAMTWPDGTEQWFQHGKRHRDDAPAFIESDGSESWYQHGKLHRVDGPAVYEVDSTTEWYQHGKLHREDGPAVIDYDGTIEWWLNGRKYSIDNWGEKLGIHDTKKFKKIKRKYS